MEVEAGLFLPCALWSRTGCEFKGLTASVGVGGGVVRLLGQSMRGKTSDVNNKSMVPLEDYDGIMEAII